MRNLATAIGSKEKEKEPTYPSPTVDHPQLSAADSHIVPPGISSPAEPDLDTDVEQPPAAAAPLCSGPPPSPKSQFPSSDTMTILPHEDEKDGLNKTVVNYFKPSLSIMLIPFIADRRNVYLQHGKRDA